MTARNRRRSWLFLGVMAAGCASESPSEVATRPPSPFEVLVDRNEINAEFVAFLATGAAGHSLLGRPRVKVTRDGIPVPGATVFWSVSEGRVSPASSETDARGIAEASDWRLGERVGQQVLVAALGQAESAKRATFTSDARPSLTK